MANRNSDAVMIRTPLTNRCVPSLCPQLLSGPENFDPDFRARL